jgi:hypothetical protein
LVNPTRKPVWEAKMATAGGYLVARTEDCQRFAVYSLQSGKEFYCGRRFTREEIGKWLEGKLPHPDERRQISDESGDIPAIAVNPQSWVWYFVSNRGKKRLKTELKPTISCLQKLAGLALQINPSNFYPLGNPYEIWVCDKDTKLPLFLTVTGNSLEEIEQQTFSPLWRFNFVDCATSNEVALRELQKLINARVNASDNFRTIKWTHRLFKRNLDNSAIEYNQDELEPIAEYPPNWLPTGLMAEPFESLRKRLEP